MQCEIARDLLGAFVDGELTGDERRDVADHVQSCATCARDAADLQRQSRQIMTVREAAPGSLAMRVRAALAEATAETPAAPAASRARPWAATAWRQASALAAACLVSSLITWSVMTWSTAAPVIEADVVSAHIRSLLQDSPIQVASADTHTVKPWFTGRLEFSPDVRDFAAQGFPLAGGRVDYVGGRRVGALVYRRNLHVVNVFVWPSAGMELIPVQRDVQKGYNIVHWNKDGMTYWAISDTNLDELSKLQSLL